MNEVVERAVLIAKEISEICNGQGILNINEKSVHLSNSAFHKLYNQYTVKPFRDGFVYNGIEVNGIEVFCLVGPNL